MKLAMIGSVSGKQSGTDSHPDYFKTSTRPLTDLQRPLDSLLNTTGHIFSHVFQKELKKMCFFCTFLEKKC